MYSLVLPGFVYQDGYIASSLATSVVTSHQSRASNLPTYASLCGMPSTLHRITPSGDDTARMTLVPHVTATLDVPGARTQVCSSLIE